MKENEKKADKQETKPDEDLKGSASAHLVIKDVKSGNDIINTRG